MRRVALDRVGIVMMTALGDAVHVLPVINAIKRHKPSAHITWVLQAGPASLVRGHPAIDDLVLFDRTAGVRGYTDVRRELASREFDVVLNLQVYFKAGVVTSFTRAPVKLGFDRARARDLNWLFTTHRIPPHAPQHVQDQYFEFLDWLGVAHERVEWILGPWDHEREAQRKFFERFDRPVAAVVVATSKAEKNWSPERITAVCRTLYNEFGLQPVLVGGKSELEHQFEVQIVQNAGVPVVSALGSGLRNLVGILDGSAVVVSPDTGPLHMCVALNRPVVSLMGYTNPKRVGPYRRFHDLMIDAYGDPGEDYPVSMQYRQGRMWRITPEQVAAKLRIWQEKYRATHPPSLPAR